VASPEGDEELFVGGKIDRVDVGVGRAVVFDYKTGGKRTSYAAQVQPEALCESAWQLPLYAAAVAAELELPSVTAHFYTLLDAGVTRPVGDEALIALDSARRARWRDEGGRNVGDALWAVARAMRGGDFRVAPRLDACERCHLEAACRVVRPPPDLVEPEGGE
jgi:hypothetical protein